MANVENNTISLKKENSSVKIHLYGATLISWKPNGQEVIFVSKNSFFDNQKPIRGGIPVIFPQFGPWEHGPQHGFARRQMWSVKGGDHKRDSGSVTVVLEDSDLSRKMWNYKFLFEYTICLISDSELKMNVSIVNTGDKAFDFTFLLHTYFSVPHVIDCEIEGLSGCTYVDKVKKGTLCEERNEKVVLSEFTDRIYQNTASVNKISNISNNRCVEIQKTNLPDTVVWNPWTENAKKMDDFGDDEWPHMICVEAGYVSNPYHLEPGKKFNACQNLKIVH